MAWQGNGSETGGANASVLLQAPLPLAKLEHENDVTF